MDERKWLVRTLLLVVYCRINVDLIWGTSELEKVFGSNYTEGAISRPYICNIFLRIRTAEIKPVMKWFYYRSNPTLPVMHRPSCGFILSRLEMRYWSLVFTVVQLNSVLVPLFSVSQGILISTLNNYVNSASLKGAFMSNSSHTVTIYSTVESSRQLVSELLPTARCVSWNNDKKYH